jgi:quercetin dioxygenase-like cupin family protein
MRKNSRISVVVAFVLAASVAAGSWSPANAQEPNVQRKVLRRQDLPTPGYEALLVDVTIPVGGREGRHSHPGTLMVYVLSGHLALDYEGRPRTTYEAGDSFTVEPGKIHEGINNGEVPVRVIATFIVEKGKPLTTQVQ